MWGTMIATVVAVLPLIEEQERAFLRSLDGLPPQERQRRIERREEIQIAASRHSELLQASRAGQRSGLLGAAVLGGIFGAAISS